MSEQDKKKEASRFQLNQEETFKKMKEIQQMLQSNEGTKSRKNEQHEYEPDPDDEFDDYFEQSLMMEADTLGILDPAIMQPDVYEQALKKVHREIEKVNNREEQIDTSSQPPLQKIRDNENDEFGDDLMEYMLSADTNSYVCEYNDVIAQVSSICQLIVKNPKTVAPTTHLEVEDLTVDLCPRIDALATDYKH